MSQTQTEFDAYRENYEAVVDRSIDFSGLKHDFFLIAKADLLEKVADERLGGAKNVSLLDVGCGVGRLHNHLKDRFRSISGCDVSSESIARAKLDNPYAEYELSEEIRLPYEDGQFDLAVTSCVMHHVPPQHWPAFSAEFRRVVRPGGLGVVIEHNPLNPLTQLAVARCPFDADAVLLRSGKTESLLRGAGFNSAKSQFFLLLPSAKPIARKIEGAFSAAPFGAQYATVGSA